jgi:hypothetical protein
VPLDEDVYMRMPPGYGKRGTVLKPNKALYGLRKFASYMAAPLFEDSQPTGI